MVALVISCETVCLGQAIKLQSAKHGLDLIHGKNVTKETIIGDVMFADGKNEEIDIIRLDNIGYISGGVGPLIISGKEPIITDSLGLIPLALPSDSLELLVCLIKLLDTKQYENILKPIYDDPSKNQIFRVTFRSSGVLGQYYITSPEAVVQYLKKVEVRLRQMRNTYALRKFHQFVWSSELLERTTKGLRWKY